MDIQKLQKEVADIVANQLGVDKEIVTLEAKVVDDLGADSLDVVELVMALEEAFDIEIPDEEAEKIVSVQDICQYLAAILG
jgi:acyl carrier protein